MAPSRRYSPVSSDEDVIDRTDFPVPAGKRRRLSQDEDDVSESEEQSSDSEAEKQDVVLAKDEEEDQSDVEAQAKTSSGPPRPVLSRVSRIRAAAEQPTPSQTPSQSATAPTNATFESLTVSPWLIHTLRSLSITNPTPIQQSCIPPILAGRDCIGGSRTGSGKTIAFAVPLLQKWAEDPFGIYAVVLTPTRELALQIYEQFRALGAPQSLKVVLITGGADMRQQAVALSQRPHIVVATPGRLADHIQTSGKETTIGLSRAKAVVLDEADRLLASGPGSMLPDLNTCLSALPPPSTRLTLLFTATITPEVRALKSHPRPSTRPPIFISEITDPSDPSSNPSSSSAPALPPTLSQTYLQLPSPHKPAYLHVLLHHLLTTSPNQQILIFTNRTTTADHLHRTLLHLEHPCTSLHSQLPQRERSANLAAFRALKAKILVATDVASRGLDIPSVGVVVNYDVPRNPADYVHRVGRTARAGREGTAITFVGARDVELVLGIEGYLSGGDVDGEEVGDGDGSRDGGGVKMKKWEAEGVNLETRIMKGRTLKDVGEARMEALRGVEQGRDVRGRRVQGMKKRRT